MIATEGALENPKINTILADTGRFRNDIEGHITNVMISTRIRCTVVFEHMSKGNDPVVLFSEEYVVDGSYFGAIERNAKRAEFFRLRFVDGSGVVQGTLTSAGY